MTNNILQNWLFIILLKLVRDIWIVSQIKWIYKMFNIDKIKKNLILSIIITIKYSNQIQQYIS